MSAGNSVFAFLRGAAATAAEGRVVRACQEHRSLTPADGAASREQLSTQRSSLFCSMCSLQVLRCSACSLGIYGEITAEGAAQVAARLGLQDFGEREAAAELGSGAGRCALALLQESQAASWQD